MFRALTGREPTAEDLAEAILKGEKPPRKLTRQ